MRSSYNGNSYANGNGPGPASGSSGVGAGVGPYSTSICGFPLNYPARWEAEVGIWV